MWDKTVPAGTKAQSFTWKAGPVSLYIKTEGPVIEAAFEYGGTDAEPSWEESDRGPSEETTWNRFITADGSDRHIIPVLPDLPLVIEPEKPVTMLPGTNAQFFLRLPLYASITAGGRNTGPQTLMEIPGLRMSKTWFGSTLEGDLCYSLKCTFFTDKPEPVPLSAATRMNLVNDSKEPLRIEKLCLHAEYLELFIDGDEVWTNSVEVRYQGDGQESSISIGEGAPEYCSGNSTYVKPRNINRKSFVQKTFDFFRLVTGV